MQKHHGLTFMRPDVLAHDVPDGLPPVATSGKPLAIQAEKSTSTSISGNLQQLQVPDEQKQARRLHRKRVARIVVDQWRWFTKERVRMYPAIRHHNHRLQLSAFLALQTHSAHRQLEWRRAAIFNHRRQYLMQGKCLLLWHAQLDYSKKTQLRLNNARQTKRLQQQRSCLQAWQDYRAYKAERRKHHLQANFYRSFVLLTSALQQWRPWAAVSAVKRAKQGIALSFWASKQYAKAYSSWTLSIALRQRSRQAKEQASHMRRRHLSTGALLRWQGAVTQMQEARQAGSEALQIIARKLQTAWLRQLLQSWTIAVTALHAWEQLKQQACSIGKQSLLKRTLTGWQAEVQQRHSLQALASQLQPVARRLHLHAAWDVWAAQYLCSLEHQGANLRKVVLLRASLKAWRWTTALEVTQQAKLARVVKLMNATCRWRCLQAWRAAADIRQKKRIRKQAASDSYNDKLLSQSLHQWQQCARWSRDSGWKEDLAFGHRAETLLLKCMEGWHLALGMRKQRRKAQQWRQQQLLMSVVRAWEDHTLYKLERQHQQRRAVRHRYFALLRQAFTAWLGSQLNQQRKRHQLRQLAAVHASWVRKQTWVVWRQQFLPAAREKSRAYARANTHWQSNALCGAMHAWAEVTEHLAARSAQLREAAVHYQLGLMAKAMHAWYTWLGRHLSNATARQECLLIAQETLARHIRRRMLTAWHDVYMHRVMKRFQVARAQGLFREHKEQHVLLIWRRYAKTQLLKAARMSAADRLNRRSQLRRGLTSWQATTRRQMAKAAAHAASLRCWSVRMMHKAFGRWKLQMSASAAQLVLVAPYAWHWRSITLQRRKQSQAQASQHAAAAYGTFDFCHDAFVPDMPMRETGIASGGISCVPCDLPQHTHTSSVLHRTCTHDTSDRGGCWHTGFAQDPDRDNWLRGQPTMVRQERLQPRRRDFTCSSQGLPHLSSALHAAHPMSGSPDHYPVLPRDPFSALPRPHQHPAKAATFPPPGFSPPPGPRSEAGKTAAGLSLGSRYITEAVTSGVFNHKPEHQLQGVPISGWTGPWSQPLSQATASQRQAADGYGGRHDSVQGAGMYSGGWQAPVFSDVAANQQPSRDAIAYSDTRLNQHPSKTRSGGNTWSVRRQVWPAGHSGRPSPEAACNGLRQPTAAESHTTQTSQLQQQHRASGTVKSQAAMQSLQVQHESLALCSAEGPSHSHHQYSCQPLSRQHASSCFDWSNCHQAAAPQSRLPMHPTGLHSAQPHGLTYRHTGHNVHEHPGLGAMGTQDSQHEAHSLVGAEVAAMEAVLADYTALRIQIADAERQLVALQGSASQAESFWLEGHQGHRRQMPSWQCESTLHPARQDAHVELAAVMDTLAQLKAAAAKQKPAVEAIAGKLQCTLSRTHA
ncbi:hypothetical protein WJX77_011009 [Trebouxia sp. C0004]